jgi:hypothetical protein
MANSRPKAEDPLGLFVTHNFTVEKHGYRWVSGWLGANGKKEQFLVPGKEPPKPPPHTRRIELAKFNKELATTWYETVKAPDDLYLKLGRVELSEPGLLAFANAYGPLGIRQRHFHSDETSCATGEPYSAWKCIVREFQDCFRLWKAMDGRDLSAVRAFLTSARSEVSVEESEQDLAREVNKYLAQVINSNMIPWWALDKDNGCIRQGRMGVPAGPYPYAAVHYHLEFDEANNRLRPTLHAFRPVFLVWLQFAELASGVRRVSMCEECRQWMDISDTARPTAKRMHDHCSHAARVRRWRKKQQAKAE